ncbi:MAG: hypothetical protein ACK5Y6_04560, partial [Pseudomonadota bacterium]
MQTKERPQCQKSYVIKDAVERLPSMSPWEDSNLSKQDRYGQYKEFLLSRVKALIAAYEREEITADEVVALANDPDNKEFLEEVNKLLNETPEQFCFRLDGGLHRELLGKNFLG